VKDHRDEETRTAAIEAEDATAPIAPAQKIGRYLVLQEVGRGGMGQVYAAYDPKLDRRVALKLLHNAEHPGERERLLREARALARISHPNVLTVHEVEEHDTQVVLALEYVSGGTLKDWLRKHPPDSEAPGEDNKRLLEVLELLVQAGKGLMAAHEEGLVHRDFKPSNVLIGRDGRVRVADFGLARRSLELTRDEEDFDAFRDLGRGSAVQTPVTQTGGVVGTPAYMAPEQWTGDDLDARTDQFSFCVVAWEMLFGERPFIDSQAVGMLAVVRAGSPQAPPGSTTPTALANTLRKGLGVRKSSRFPQLGEVVAALEIELQRLGGRVERSRSWGLWKLLVTAAVGVGVYLGGHAANDWRIEQNCRTEADQLDELWSPEVAHRTQRAIRATGLSFAPAVADNIVPWLERKADAWKKTHTGVCVATRVRGEHTAEELGRAQWCLDDRRIEMAALLAQLEDPTTNTVINALQATASLRSVEPCRDMNLLARLPTPPHKGLDGIQRVRAQLARAKLRREAGDYDEALHLARSGMSQAEVLGWPQLLSAASLEVGLVESELYDLDKSTESLQKAFFSAQKAGALEEAFDAAIALASVVGVQAAEFDEADLWLQHAEVALEALPRDKMRESEFLRTNGLLAKSFGDYSGALGDLTATLSTLESEVGAEHPALGRAAMDIADVEFALGHTSAAKETYEHRLSEVRTLFGERHPRAATIQSKLAEVAVREGDYETAEKHALRALDILEVGVGDHPALSSALTALATVNTATDQLEDAIETARRCLELEKEHRPAGHPAILSAASRLAQAYGRNGQRETAIAVMKEALRHTEERVGPEHPLLVGPLGTLSGIYTTEGHSEGLKTALRAKTIAGALSPTHPGAITATMHVANAQFYNGDIEESVASYREAKRSLIANVGAEDILVADLSDSLANALAMQGEHDESISLREEALAIYAATTGMDSRPALRALRNTAVHYSMLGNDELALEKSLEALEIQRRTSSPRDPELAKALLNIGSFASRTESNLDYAMGFFEEALEIWEANGSPQRCYADVNIANTLRMMHEPEKSLVAATTAVDTCKHEAPKLAESQFVLARALAVNGKRRAAMKLARTARQGWKDLGVAEQVAKVDEFLDGIDEFTEEYRR